MMHVFSSGSDRHMCALHPCTRPAGRRQLAEEELPKLYREVLAKQKKAMDAAGIVTLNFDGCVRREEGVLIWAGVAGLRCCVRLRLLMIAHVQCYPCPV
jgi:hypothetical protein